MGSAPIVAAELFGPASAAVAVGDGPVAVAVGEFNGDGAADLATANQSGSVSLLRGDGLGGFVAAGEIGGFAGPSSVAVGDFNRDGAADLVVADIGFNLDPTRCVSIMLGDGSGNFVRMADIPIGQHFTVAMGEFNGDGITDLAVAKEVDASVGILLGDGFGGFVWSADVGVGSGSVAVGEFNGDGFTDLAVLGRELVILSGNGLGGFEQTAALPVDGFSIAVGEFNGDRSADLAITSHPDSPLRFVSILLGDGLGGFFPTAEIDVGRFLGSVVVGEFNGDSVVDLVVPHEGSALAVLLGNGLGGFARTTDVAVGEIGTLAGVGVGEFNGDGSADLAVISRVGNSVGIHLGTGLGGFAQTADIGLAKFPTSVAVGDVNGDDTADLLVAHAGIAVIGEAGDTVSVLLGDGLGGFASAADVHVGPSPRSVAVGEFDGDGNSDLAVTRHDSLMFPPDGFVGVLLGDGHGGFVQAAEIAVGPAPSSVAVAEFNGDGAADLVTANEADDSVSVLLGDGRGGFQRGLDVGVGRRPGSIAVAEFDGDGALDLAVANFGNESVSILLGDGHGGFLQVAQIAVGPNPASIAVGQFDGGGALDLAVAILGDDSVSILLGDGRGGFQRVTIALQVQDFAPEVERILSGRATLRVIAHPQVQRLVLGKSQATTVVDLVQHGGPLQHHLLVRQRVAEVGEAGEPIADRRVVQDGVVDPDVLVLQVVGIDGDGVDPALPAREGPEVLGVGRRASAPDPHAHALPGSALGDPQRSIGGPGDRLGSRDRGEVDHGAVLESRRQHGRENRSEEGGQYENGYQTDGMHHPAYPI